MDAMTTAARARAPRATPRRTARPCSRPRGRPQPRPGGLPRHHRRRRRPHPTRRLRALRHPQHPARRAGRARRRPRRRRGRRAPHDDPVVHIALLGRLVWAEVEHVRAMARVVVRGPLREQIGTAARAAPARSHRVEHAARLGAGRDDVPAETVARLIEGGAFAVLDEATRADLARAGGPPPRDPRRPRRARALLARGARRCSPRTVDRLAPEEDRLRLELDRTSPSATGPRPPCPRSTRPHRRRPALVAVAAERGPCSPP